MLEQNGDTLRTQTNGGSIVANECFLSKMGNKCELSTKDIDMIRLIGQYLCDKGLNLAYMQLSKESGIPLEHADATELRHAILEGRWKDAELAVERIASLVGDNENIAEVGFLLFEQQFLEHLEGNEILPAVTLLRNRITPMKRNTERVHTLASCLMCRTPAELQAQAGGWTGKDSGSRLQLINRIQAFVPPHIMLPPRRLEELIAESVRSQLATCIFHNPSTRSTDDDVANVSLLQRHSCGMQDFPAFCIQTLEQRDTDLWVCQFSPDGSLLATAGKEDNVDVWRVEPSRHTISFYRILHTPAYVSCLCWSPDSKKLAACCREEQSSMFVFEVASGQQLCARQVNSEDTYSTACFFADSRKLAFGGLKGTFYVMDTEDDGAILATVEGYRVQSMAAILPPPPGSLPAGRYPLGIPIGGGQSTVYQRRPTDLFSAPGGPGSFSSQVPGGALISQQQHQVLNCAPLASSSAATGGDQLVIADSLNRIRLFRFGPLGGGGGGSSAASGRSMDLTVTASHPPSSLSLSSVPSFVIGETNTSGVSVSTSSAPASVPMETQGETVGTPTAPPGAVGAAPGAPISTGSQSLANALAVARLSRQQRQQQQQMLQSTANILVDMPILPANLALLSSPNIIQQQTMFEAPGPYTIASTVGATIASSMAPPASSLTILFGSGQPGSQFSLASGGGSLATGTTMTTDSGLLVTSASSTTASPSSSTDVRVLTAAAAAAAALAGSHSRSFAGLVHSMSTIATGGASVASSWPSSTMAAALAASVSDTSAAPGPPVDALSSGQQRPPGSNYGLLEHRTLFKETHPIHSIAVSRSGQQVLITLHKMSLHLWDLDAAAIVQSFVGHKQNTLRMHSTFGGAAEDFVAAGSEDGRVYFWHATSGSHPIYSAVSAPPAPNGGHANGCTAANNNGMNPIGSLAGSLEMHTTDNVHLSTETSGGGAVAGSRMPVTCVHWNPALPTMLASVNDAGEICVWGPQRYVRSGSQPMDDG